MAQPVNPQAALEYLATAAKRVLPLTEADAFNLAVKTLGEIIQDKQARDAIEAAKAKDAVPNA